MKCVLKYFLGFYGVILRALQADGRMSLAAKNETKGLSNGNTPLTRVSLNLFDKFCSFQIISNIISKPLLLVQDVLSEL